MDANSIVTAGWRTVSVFAFSVAQPVRAIPQKAWLVAHTAFRVVPNDPQRSTLVQRASAIKMLGHPEVVGLARSAFLPEFSDVHKVLGRGSIYG